MEVRRDTGGTAHEDKARIKGQKVDNSREAERSTGQEAGTRRDDRSQQLRKGGGQVHRGAVVCGL